MLTGNYPLPPANPQKIISQNDKYKVLNLCPRNWITIRWSKKLFTYFRQNRSWYPWPALFSILMALSLTLTFQGSRDADDPGWWALWRFKKKNVSSQATILQSGSKNCISHVYKGKIVKGDPDLRPRTWNFSQTGSQCKSDFGFSAVWLHN